MASEIQENVIVVLPAYNAAKTIAGVYAKIPENLKQNVILVDDGSTDNTVEVAQSLGIKTIRHEANKGYGSNQKTCYQEALVHDPDVVIMLHPDGQHDPEEIHTILKMFKNNSALMGVFGSRMMHRTNAWTGRMPWWKFGSNIALTKFANSITGSRLTDWHTGYRGYRKEVFALPYQQFDDDFNFDVDMTLGLVKNKWGIAEIPVKTYYFPEASQINFKRSLRYGMKFVRQVLQSALRAS